MRILHLFGSGPIMLGFIHFIDKNFPKNDHLFVLPDSEKYPLPILENVVNISHLSKLDKYRTQLKEMYAAEKIILHGLFDIYSIFPLIFQPWILKKCYWVIWGGDLYSHVTDPQTPKWHIVDFLKKIIIPRIGHIVTHIKGDYELAQKWYGAKGQWHDCFMYPSNVFKKSGTTPAPHQGTNILLGNSATPTNNHMNAFQKLRPYANEDIRIYCPLSYGDNEYANEIEEVGSRIFGDKFIAIREFMPHEKYLDILAKIDIGIFNHSRQQAVGNISTLLGLGKAVFINRNVTTFSMLKSLGVEIFDIEDLAIPLDFDTEKLAQRNIKIISAVFTEKNLKKQLFQIF